MARLLSAPVLAGSAVLTSPALWAALVDETMKLETAAIRLVIAAVLLWCGLSLLQTLIHATSPAAEPGDPAHRAPSADGSTGGL